MTEADIIDVLELLERAGCPAPCADPEQAAKTISVWLAVFGDHTKAQLEAAALGHLAGPKARYWPTPGQLVALLPVEAREPTAETDEDEADRWRAAYQRARREVAAQPHCCTLGHRTSLGGPCPDGCVQCTDWLQARVDELVAGVPMPELEIEECPELVLLAADNVIPWPVQP